MFGLEDVFLYAFVYLINKLVLILDALDDPVVHFVGQCSEDAEVLEIYLFNSTPDLI
jgi:hypothetical protein